MNPEQLVLLPMLAFIGLILVLLVVLPAQQAYRRGYNPIVWGLAGIFSSNPIFILVVLAMVPHRSRVKLRQQYRDELDEKLAAIGVGPEEAAPKPVRVDTYSVGDQVTEMPQRSIGDDLTRM